MTSLAEPPRKQITPDACPACRKAVVVAQLAGEGKLRRVLVERCKAGDIALTEGIFTGDTYAYRADRVSTRTRWRLHEGNYCAGLRAFSSANFSKKSGKPTTQRVSMSDKKYSGLRRGKRP
jgi:hypothetical protein